MSVDSETANIRAVLVNSGRFSIPDADARLAATSLFISIGDEAARTPAGQAAFLTAVATASRCFGRVGVAGNLDTTLVLPLPILATTLADAVTVLDAYPGDNRFDERSVAIGSGIAASGSWSVQAFWDGWVAGVAPGAAHQPVGRSECPLAGIAAGALAVGQAFLAEQGDPRAGRTVQSLSLWSPDVAPAAAENPPLGDLFLPAALWLVGLGNLGQAYLWSLFTLPYSDPADVLLVLQDDDLATSTNWGTSLLVEKGRCNVLKTKIAEEWAERRKFQARRIDRRLDGTYRRQDHEPAVALSGLDRMPPRRLLGLPGFEYVIDCGLGATVSTFQDVRANVFDKQFDPAKHFKNVEDSTDEIAKALLALPAYQNFAREQNDGGCGAAMLAEKSVAVPFVSAFAGTLGVTQAIRLASGAAPYKSLTVTSGDMRTMRATPGERPSRVSIETAEIASCPDGS